jgi:hypothetical protein
MRLCKKSPNDLLNDSVPSRAFTVLKMIILLIFGDILPCDARPKNPIVHETKNLYFKEKLRGEVSLQKQKNIYD